MGHHEAPETRDEPIVDLTGPEPAVSPHLRSGVYVATLAVNVLVIVVNGVVSALWPEHAVECLAVTGALTAATGVLCSGLGVVYRPTAQTQVPEAE